MYSPITEKYVGQKITLNDACAATMHTSDNTAANIIINAVAGTDGITDFVRRVGDKTTCGGTILTGDANFTLPDPNLAKQVKLVVSAGYIVVSNIGVILPIPQVANEEVILEIN